MDTHQNYYILLYIDQLKFLSHYILKYHSYNLNDTLHKFIKFHQFYRLTKILLNMGLHKNDHYYEFIHLILVYSSMFHFNYQNLALKNF
jgi:hypothetical protein